MEGWIKLHRKIIKHWIWDNPSYLKGWVYILYRANHEPNKILMGSHLEPVLRGEFITSREKFAKDTGMTIQSTRTFWGLLEVDEMITKKSTSKLTRITVCNYGQYQDQQPTANQPATNQQPGRNQPATTDKNVKNVKNVEKRKKVFVENLNKFREKYPAEMIKEFLGYWGEMNKSKTKMRWELQPTWEVSRRLATWNKKNQEQAGPAYTRTSESAPEDYGKPNPKAITRAEFKAQQKKKDDGIH